MMVFLLQLAALVSCCIAVQASVSGRSLVPRQAVSNITHNPQQSIVSLVRSRPTLKQMTDALGRSNGMRNLSTSMANVS